MKKIKPSDLRREAQAMILDGTMPSLETLLQAVADVREKYAQEIKGPETNESKQKDSQLRLMKPSPRVVSCD